MKFIKWKVKNKVKKNGVSALLNQTIGKRHSNKITIQEMKLMILPETKIF